MEEYYCNESTYSSLNVLVIHGLIKLESSCSSEDGDAPFDAWPTLNQKQTTVGKLHHILDQHGITDYMPEGTRRAIDQYLPPEARPSLFMNEEDVGSDDESGSE